MEPFNSFIFGNIYKLKQLTDERIRESELLVSHDMYAGVFYLSGYAVEFGLKAVVCKTLGLEMFDNDPLVKRVARSFKIHRIQDLVILSGLHPKLALDMSTNVELTRAWTKVSDWSEQRRYDHGCDETTAREFVQSVKYFVSWIKTNW